MGDFSFCGTFAEDYPVFRWKIENGTLTEEELIEFDKRYGCRFEWTYQPDYYQTSKYSRPPFRSKENIYENPIIKRK